MLSAPVASILSRQPPIKPAVLPSLLITETKNTAMKAVFYYFHKV
jgi:hypothetical protein